MTLTLVQIIILCLDYSSSLLFDLATSTLFPSKDTFEMNTNQATSFYMAPHYKIIEIKTFNHDLCGPRLSCLYSATSSLSTPYLSTMLHHVGLISVAHNLYAHFLLLFVLFKCFPSPCSSHAVT